MLCNDAFDRIRSKRDAQLWGLAINPMNQDLVYTCSDDGTLRCWSLSQKKLLQAQLTNLDDKMEELPLDPKYLPSAPAPSSYAPPSLNTALRRTHAERLEDTERGLGLPINFLSRAPFSLRPNALPPSLRTQDLADGVKGRAIAVSPDGESIAVGFKDGALRIFDKALKQKNYIKAAKECISDIKFSPDGLLLAAGSHDNSIYVYQFPEMKPKCKPLRKHASYITHIDFSMDGKYLHSNCGNYELLYWDLGSSNLGKTINGVSLLRDEKW